MSLALISPGPFTSNINFLGSSDITCIDNDLTLRTISVTSSLTPLMEENSCNTPSICIAVMADPCIEERRILLNELPMVKAYPFSKGSAINVVKDLSSLLCIFSLLGLIKSFQLRFITVFCIFIILFSFLVALDHCEQLELHLL